MTIRLCRRGHSLIILAEGLISNTPLKPLLPLPRCRHSIAIASNAEIPQRFPSRHGLNPACFPIISHAFHGAPL